MSNPANNLKSHLYGLLAWDKPASILNLTMWAIYGIILLISL